MATRYCGPSNTGSGSGNDFNNLLALPDTTGFVRGDVYIVVDGSYGGKTLSTATSSTTTITIRKASAANSAVAGYSSTLHDGEATFGDIFLTSQYWVIDGVTRTETNVMEAPAGYGIRCTSCTGADAFVDADTSSNSQFSFLDVGGSWSTETTPTCANTNGAAIRFVYVHHDLTFTRCCFHNKGSSNSAIGMMHGTTDITFDHCDFYQGWGKATIATPNVGQTRHTTKYCRFWNASRSEGTVCGGEGTGITTELGTYSFAGTTDGHLVHGCTFYGTASGGRNSVIQYGESSPGPTATNCKIHNNTFVGFPEDPVVAHIYLFSGSGNEARNNLFWDVAGVMEITANASSNNVDATSNPFISGGYPTTLDFRISSTSQARDAGTNVGAPYNIDPLGATRGGDGTWDAGAYEFATGGPVPNAPTNLRLI